MAKIRGEVDTTPDQERMLNKTFLPAVNEERAAQEPPLEPLADMDEYASWLLGHAMPDWVEKSKDKDSKEVGDAYEEADLVTQAEVEAILFP